MNEPARSPTEEQLSGLRSELGELASDAFKRAAHYHRWTILWQVADTVLGVSAAVLAAVAGATGLASTAGRIPAAIMALTAAGLGAATRFLGSGERAERNWRRANAWQLLGHEARFAGAADGYPGTRNLYDTIRDLIERRAAIMEMDHYPLPERVMRKPAEGTG
jgi:hypothetical protein